jgi:hypothetical protein
MGWAEAPVAVWDGQASRGEGEYHATRIAGAYERSQAGGADEQAGDIPMGGMPTTDHRQLGQGLFDLPDQPGVGFLICMRQLPPPEWCCRDIPEPGCRVPHLVRATPAGTKGAKVCGV